MDQHMFSLVLPKEFGKSVLWTKKEIKEAGFKSYVQLK